MDKTVMPCHDKYLEFLRDTHNVDIYWESHYAYFFANTLNVFKVRKKNCIIFPANSARSNNYLTILEFERGKTFQPSHYCETIEMPSSQSIVDKTLILVMKRLSEDERYDAHIAKHGICFMELETLVSRTKHLLNNAAPKIQCNHVELLASGSNRLIELIKSSHINMYTKKILLETKTYLDISRKKLAKEIKERSNNGYFRELHGDLSWSNIYLDNKNFVFLDPCVASEDMYVIDIDYQICDLFVDFITNTSYDITLNLISRFKAEGFLDLPNSLLFFYLTRHLFIRACVKQLVCPNNHNDYLRVLKNKSYVSQI